MTNPTPPTNDQTLREQLHQFAISYHVESKEGRQSDLDYMMSLIRAHYRSMVDELLKHSDVYYIHITGLRANYPSIKAVPVTAISVMQERIGGESTDGA